MRLFLLKTLFFCCFVSTLNAQIESPAPSPFATVIQNVGLSKVTIEYSRPSLKGRKMIGSALVPFDKVWRTGANKIPNLITTKDMTIEGQKLPAGKYGIATIPGKTEWTVIITKNFDQWGVYNYKDSEDLLRIKVKTEKTKQKEEHFTMEFTDFTSTSAKIAIRWENAQIKFNLAHDPKAEIMAEIKEKMAAKEITTDTYYDAANYYFENNLDLNQAFEWSNKLVEKDPQYWTYYVRAKIAAKLGKCDVAKADALKGVELAKKDNDPAYVANHEKILAQCK
ncbi:MAG: hypothetical protein RIR11_30 [Bacteroidota bacterium]|jgi:hypothetical protein